MPKEISIAVDDREARGNMRYVLRTVEWMGSKTVRHICRVIREPGTVYGLTGQ